MSVDLLDITPLAKKLHAWFIGAQSSADALTRLADAFVTARTSVSGGRVTTVFDGASFVYGLNSCPGMVTMDGVVVTDFSLSLKEFLMATLSPALGQKPERDPMAAADYMKALTLRFFSGGSTGGAVYDRGRWQIHPVWLPILPPTPVQALSSTIDAPAARTLAHLFPTATADARDAQKAQAAVADPNFSLLAIGGTTMVDVALTGVQRKGGAALAEWKPTLVYSGSTADQNVVTRPGTFVAADHPDWRSDAFDALLSEGYVLANLQVPRVFSHPELLSRLEFDTTGCWFVGKDKDWKIAGLTEALVSDVRANLLGYKVGWLDELRGYQLPDSVRATAYTLSPLGRLTMSAVLKPTVNVSAVPFLTLTDARRAWVRSQPNISAGQLWLANTSCGSISKPWVDAIDPALYNQLEGIA